ncbi:MAG: pantothenate kinase [Nostocaceae cyanobacterium]|nr:pantothenate kinase [Nostocaceae cyanobacterium]
METWLALMIGNSRLHWGLFTGKTLQSTWNTDYLPKSAIHKLAQSQTLADLSSTISLPTLPTLPTLPPPLLLASVVPGQTQLWQTYENIRIITLEQIPLQGLYPTLGIDRALALFGAGKTLGFPIMVIDAGTALTFTGADSHQNLVGGAILPGLGLQFATLGEKTGKLPFVRVHHLVSLPYRWGKNTQEAIKSGIFYTILAGIKDFIEAWWKEFPEGKVVITGGDRTLIAEYIELQAPQIAASLIVEANLIFWGMGEIITSFPAEDCL